MKMLVIVFASLFAISAHVSLRDAGGAPTRIVQSWVSKRGTMGNVDAWMKANADNLQHYKRIILALLRTASR